MNTSREPETSIICVTYVYTRRTRLHNKLLSHQGMASVARPCQREAAANAGKVMRGRVGRVQNIDDNVVCFIDYCSILTRVLDVAVFFFAADASSQ